MARSPRKSKALAGALATSAYSSSAPPIEGQARLELSEREAQGHFVAKVLALLDGQERDLTQEATWEELGRLVVKHWSLFDAEQSSISTMRMLQVCAEMKLKIRLAQSRTPANQDEDLLTQYEALMQDVFAPGDALEGAEGPDVDEET